MDFELTDDQVALQDGVRHFCEGRFPMAVVRALEDDGGVDRAAWRELADVGVFSLRQPVDADGAGLGWADAMLVFEELGRALVPGPLVWTHLATDLAVVADAAGAGRLVVGGVDGLDPIGRIDATEPFAVVEHLDALDTLLVVDDDGIRAVDPRSPRVTPVGTPLDPLTPVSEVSGPWPAGDQLADAAAARALRLGGAALTAAFLLGVSEAATELAVEYAKGRVQFDRPIGTFQALKHLMADMLVRTEVARGAVYAAGVTLDDPLVGSAERAVAAAKVTAAEAGIRNAQTAIQVHGGMGYTWEIDAHLLLKRAYVLEQSFGDRDHWSERMAELLDVGVGAAAPA
jgi:alkylation response protein AidB-like acyl-CoA dehydrogenase